MDRRFMGIGISEMEELVKSLKNEFKQNELAYHQIAGKNEGVLRDRFISKINGKEPKYRYAVSEGARKRIDIVIYHEISKLRNNKIEKFYIPNCLVEFKLYYSFDALDKKEEIFYGKARRKGEMKKGGIFSDLQNLEQYEACEKHECPQKYAVLFLIHLHRKEPFGDGYKDMVTYFVKANSFIGEKYKQLNYDTTEVFNQCTDYVKETLNNQYTFKAGRFTCGNAYDTEVEMFYYIIRKDK